MCGRGFKGDLISFPIFNSSSMKIWNQNGWLHLLRTGEDDQRRPQGLQEQRKNGEGGGERERENSPLELGGNEDILVELGGMVPAEILCHAPALQSLPALLVVPEGVEAVAQRMDQFSRLGPVKSPA